MLLNINNRAQISRKYLRSLKWRLFQIKEEMQNLLSVEIHIDHDDDGHYSIKSDISTMQGRCIY